MMKRLFPILVFNIFTIFTFAQNSDSFFDIKSIQTIKINFATKNWVAVLDSLKVNGEEMLVATVSIGNKTYNNCGVAYRGSNSYRFNHQKNPLHIRLNYINSAQNHEGITDINLSIALRDPSMVREVLGFEIARNYMVAPRANYARVYVNDSYNGLFVNVEDINEGFLKRNLNENEGTFLKASNNPKELEGCRKEMFGSLYYEENASCYLTNYKLLSKTGWDDLIQLTKLLAESPDKIESVLNIDQTLWMLAFNNAFVNLSSYSGDKSYNYFLYKDKTGRFIPIIWDLNLCFGSLKNTGIGSDLSLENLQKLDPLLHLDNLQKPLISQLLKNPEYKKKYLFFIRTLVMNHIDNNSYLKRAIELQQFIKSDYANDKNLGYKVTDLEKSLRNTIGETSKIPGLAELMEKRGKFLKKNSLLLTVPPHVSSKEFAKREKNASSKISKFTIKAKIEGYPQKVFLKYRLKPSDAWASVQILDNGIESDEKAGDNIYSYTVDPQGVSQEMEYYLEMENKAAIGFDPPSYLIKPNIVKLKDLN